MSQFTSSSVDARIKLKKIQVELYKKKDLVS